MDQYPINQYKYNNRQPQGGYGYGQSLEQRVSAAMRGVFLKMFVGLLVTAGVAFAVSSTVAPYYLATHQWVYWGLFIVELGVVWYLSARIGHMQPMTAMGLFLLYAALNGVVFSMIFLAYSLPAIGKTFLITAAVFGAMTVYGYLTNKDLAGIGSFLFMALIGLIIACVVNMFWANSTLEWIISIVGVLIFVGLTAWDTQRIKRFAEQDPTMMGGRLSTIGALSLYLDFINMFIFLLRIFGGNRN